MNNLERIAHIEYVQDKNIKYKLAEERYYIAVKRWFMCGGELPSHTIAEYLNINNHKLTLMIQKKMAQMTDVKLKDNAPNVLICYSESELYRRCPQSYQFVAQPIYELDYYNYLANNSREQIIHNYKLYLHESRSRNLQGSSKLPNNKIPKGDI